MGLQVAIIGAGLMGHGIAQVFATAGHEVVIVDVNDLTLSTVHNRVSASLAELGIESGSVLGRIKLNKCAGDAVRDCSVVIEAVPERLDLKRALFQEIAETAPVEALLASNTSTIPITEIGRDLPESARRRLVGLHWWYPAVLIPLVEVIATDFVDPEYFDRAFQLMASIGKEPVRVNRDIPGFLGNRLLHALNREALSLVNSGVCDAETIDKVIKLSFGRRFSVLGPMEGIDLVGLELVRNVHNILFPYLEDSSEASPLLDRLIDRHNLGMATGEGLRKWTAEQIAETKSHLSTHLLTMARGANGKG
ncbi:MAG TPA: 3-hydroxyacyl-CoA dehydrogenase family protein [Terriglobales bacterium]|nr:3-hydroxyacyl-CoA dehydrogenase family protein [Terriglobales bacterium]